MQTVLLRCPNTYRLWSGAERGPSSASQPLPLSASRGRFTSAVYQPLLARCNCTLQLHVRISAETCSVSLRIVCGVPHQVWPRTVALVRSPHCDPRSLSRCVIVCGVPHQGGGSAFVGFVFPPSQSPGLFEVTAHLSMSCVALLAHMES